MDRNTSRRRGESEARQRHVRGEVLVQDALRGCAGHEPGGADRGRALGLLLDGAQRRTRARRLSGQARSHDRQRLPRQGERRRRHHAHRAGVGGRGAGHRRGGVPGAGQDGEGELPDLEGSRRRRNDYAQRQTGVGDYDPRQLGSGRTMKFIDKLQYLRYLVDKRGMKPVYLILGLTYDCNSFCRTCFNWEQLRKNKEHELSLEELQKTFATMGDLLFVVMSGGEPFLRRDLPEVCETLSTKNRVKQITIPTGAIASDLIARSVESTLQK